MSPYSAGGHWVPAPGVSYLPPTRAGDEPRPIPRHLTNATDAAATAAAALQAAAAARTTSPTAGGDSDWGPSTLTGTRTVNIGGSRFLVPRSAEVKLQKRSGTAWVRTSDGRTHVLSELGELKQTEAEQRSTRWDLL